MTTIKKLSALNVAAINETMLTGVTTTASTATFTGTVAEAIALVEQTIGQLGGGNAHPRGSLHAVLRKLNKLAETETTTTEPEFPTMAISPEEFAKAILDEIHADTDPQAVTAETVVLPEGITETPALRPVYAAILNAGSGTAKDIVDATGIILPKVRVALNTLKAAGLVTGTEQGKPGQAVVWFAGINAAMVADQIEQAMDEIAAQDADAAAGAEIDEAVESTGHLPGNDEPEAGWNSMNDDNEDPQPTDDDSDNAPADDDEDDTPAATVDAPVVETAKPRRVRLLAAYRNDPAPSAGGGKGKQMGPILEHLMANPGVEFTVRETQNALGLPDYPSAAHERLAADPSTGVTRVNHGNRKKFVYNPVAPVAAPAAE